MTEQDSMPVGVDRARHRDLTGRHWHVWWRRFVLLAVATLPVLGLLNFFGQRAASTDVHNAAVSVKIVAPAAVRGGLVFTTDVVVTPRVTLNNCELYLGQGWFSGMTLNGMSPQPSMQSSQGDWQVWQFGKLAAGQPFRLWISWQTNPTTVGHRFQPLAVYDGATRLLTAYRTMTIFP